MILELVEVGKQYNNNWILKNINLKLEKNQIAMIIGPNGSGKSTLLKIIIGLVIPERGKINLFDKAPINFAKKQIAFMHEQVSIYPYVSIYDYLKYVAKIYGKYRDLESKIENYLELFDLSDHKYKRVNQLSAGMKKLVAIIKCLLVEPKLLLLDEPFANLDAKWKEKLTQILVKEKTEKNTTILIATHIMAGIDKHADLLVFLSEGTVKQIVHPKTESVNVKELYLKYVGGETIE